MNSVNNSISKKNRRSELQQMNINMEKNGYFIECKDDTNIFLIENTVPNPKANVLIISPFGKSVHDLFLITYYLSFNGFNVFRFDPRDHAGLSSGCMEEFTLHKLERDIYDVNKYFNYDKNIPTIVLSMSLSFPVALKYVATSNKADGIISIVGVVDPDYTSCKASGIAPDEFRKPVITAPVYSEPFGCRINNKNYVDGLDSGKFSSYEDILGYLKQIKKPICMIAAENDEYVKIEDVKKFFNNKPVHGELIVLPGVTHEIGRSISAAKLVAKQVVSYALSLSGRDDEIKVPSLVEVIAQSEKESEYINTFKNEQ